MVGSPVEPVASVEPAAAAIEVSAQTGAGVPGLRSAIVQHLGGSAGSPSAAVSNARHIEVLSRAERLLAQASAAAARASPSEMIDLKQDYFALFGLVPAFSIDMERLEQAYIDIQARVHPDRFAAEGAAAQRVAAPGTQVLGRQPSFGPLSIESHFDEAFGAGPLLLPGSPLARRPQANPRRPPTRPTSAPSTARATRSRPSCLMQEFKLKSTFF